MKPSRAEIALMPLTGSIKVKIKNSLQLAASIIHSSIINKYTSLSHM